MGFGKSLPYEICIPLMRKMNPGFSAGILVCSSLDVLMQDVDQVKQVSAVTDINLYRKKVWGLTH